jgi:hypothetical protein
MNFVRHKLFFISFIFSLFLFAGKLQAQQSPAASDSMPSKASGAETDQPLLSDRNLEAAKQLVPGFDPRSDTVVWNGGAWKADNNRLFRSQFLKYLNEPELVDEESIKYGKVLNEIQILLSSQSQSNSNLDKAWSKLFEAAKHETDANLCQDIADSVYAVWQGKQEQDHLGKANQTIRNEMEQVSRNMSMEVGGDSLFERPPQSEKEGRSWMENQQLQREYKLKPYEMRLKELEATTLANALKKEASELGAKIQFQTIIVQMFAQRRFEHVVIACRFYQNLFGDGDQKMRVGDQAKAMLAGLGGVDPTVSVISSLAHDAMKKVDDGVKAYLFHMENKELNAGTERLQEAYAVGLNLPSIKTLPRAQKRLGYEYMYKSGELFDALEVKDYTYGQKLVDELKSLSPDFNATKPLAAIETARTLSRMRLAKAKVAASRGDDATLEAELKAAVEIWPRNPELEKLSLGIFGQADVQQQALADLDRLMAQKNHREIYENRAKYIAATAMQPDKAKELEPILLKIGEIEVSLAQCRKVSQLGDDKGAWEALELLHAKYPDDSKIREDRLEYANRAPGYVSDLNKAAALKAKGDLGSSFSWYLKAYAEYPPGKIAQNALDSMLTEMFPMMKKNQSGNETSTPSDHVAPQS